MTGIALIAAERQRQIEDEGWTSDHDDTHFNGEMAIAAAYYATPKFLRELYSDGVPKGWPWDVKWWKPSPDNRIRELSKAGALIAAEIDRLTRKNENHHCHTDLET